MCCIYMPTDSACASVIEDSYIKLKEDVLGFMQKGRVVLPGDFNARVGRTLGCLGRRLVMPVEIG